MVKSMGQTLLAACFAITILVACSGDETFLGTVDSSEGQAYQQVVDGMTALNQAAAATHPYLTGPKDSNWFDVNSYFTVLTHLQPEGSTVLDYVYYFDGNGRPFLYGRPDSADPISSYEEYVMYVTSAPENSPYSFFLDPIEVEDCDAGYFEAVLLKLLGGQFYLAWHDLYNDTRVVCCRSTVESIVDELDLGVHERRARQLELAVRFHYDAEYAYVSLVTFSKWGGFFRREFSVTRSLPLTVQQVSSICVAAYDCGYVF